MNFKQAIEAVEELAKGDRYSVGYKLIHENDGVTYQRCEVMIRNGPEDGNFHIAGESTFELAIANLKDSLNEVGGITENLENITDDLVVPA